MSADVEDTTIATVKVGDTIHFANTPYVVVSIDDEEEDRRSIVFARTNRGRPYLYEHDLKVKVTRAPSEPFDTQLREEFAEDSDLAHDTCTTCLTSITEVDGIWYHDHGDGHGLAQHLARPSKR